MDPKVLNLGFACFCTIYHFSNPSMKVRIKSCYKCRLSYRHTVVFVVSTTRSSILQVKISIDRTLVFNSLGRTRLIRGILFPFSEKKLITQNFFRSKIIKFLQVRICNSMKLFWLNGDSRLNLDKNSRIKNS